MEPTESRAADELTADGAQRRPLAAPFAPAVEFVLMVVRRRTTTVADRDQTGREAGSRS